MKRVLALVALVCSGACGTTRVDQRTVDALPLESKLDLIEAENDLFIAIDAVDEASTRLLELRDEYRNADVRIDEAKEALKQAEAANDTKLVEIGQLSLQESKQRKDYLAASEDVQGAMLELSKLRLVLAQARFERSKAMIVKKANIEGAHKIELEVFDKQLATLEEDEKKENERASNKKLAAEKVRGVWYATRRDLAQKTGGGQGSPWVE